MTLDELNSTSPEDLAKELTRCCGSRAWVAGMVNELPFADRAALLATADRIWKGLKQDDWLEAFGHHPMIGDVSQLAEKFAATSTWAAGEQKGAASASREILERLAAGNREYLRRFGFIFIVCATGKSANEMLALLEDRINRSPETELETAAEEQRKITRIRLEKLLG